MSRKDHDDQDGDIAQIRETLARLSRKVREHSGSAGQPPAPTAGMARGPAAPEDASVDEIHEKLQRLGSYVRERVRGEEPEIPHPPDPGAGTRPVRTNLPGRLGMGLELGTSRIAAAREGRGRRVLMRGERNVFLPIELDEPMQGLLRELELEHVSVGDGIYLLGDSALDLASVLDLQVRRTMPLGVLAPEDTESLSLIGTLLYRTLGKPRHHAEVCCFSVPSPPIDAELDIAGHRLVFEDMLESIGFTPCSVEEGYAVVLSELEDRAHTGIGVSCGGGMTNVCAAIEAAPVVSFSISGGEDWIDENAAAALQMPAAGVTILRDGGLNLGRPAGLEEKIIAAHYGLFIAHVCEVMADVFRDCSAGTQFDEPVDVVFSGGLTSVDGFIQVAGEHLMSLDFGFPLGSIGQAARPLASVSLGCLLGAIEHSSTIAGNNCV